MGSSKTIKNQLRRWRPSDLDRLKRVPALGGAQGAGRWKRRWANLQRTPLAQPQAASSLSVIFTASALITCGV